MITDCVNEKILNVSLNRFFLHLLYFFIVYLKYKKVGILSFVYVRTLTRARTRIQTHTHTSFHVSIKLFWRNLQSCYIQHVVVSQIAVYCLFTIEYTSQKLFFDVILK